MQQPRLKALMARGGASGTARDRPRRRRTDLSHRTVTRSDTLTNADSTVRQSVANATRRDQPRDPQDDDMLAKRSAQDRIPRDAVREPPWASPVNLWREITIGFAIAAIGMLLTVAVVHTGTAQTRSRHAGSSHAAVIAPR
jgi:hypothetical protein